MTWEDLEILKQLISQIFKTLMEVITNSKTLVVVISPNKVDMMVPNLALVHLEMEIKILILLRFSRCFLDLDLVITFLLEEKALGMAKSKKIIHLDHFFD